MALFELKIYGDDDEVLKTFESDRLRWGTLIEATRIHDESKDKPAAERLNAIATYVKSIFPTITDDDLAKADVVDLMNTFQQVLSVVDSIKADKAKNS